MSGSESQPFEIAVPDAALADLRRRLAATRLAPAFPDDGWRLGTDRDYLAQLVDHWRHQYDWRAHEAAMNRLAHWRVVIDEVPIHFIHERGRGPNPVPVVLIHGWPWTFWDYQKVIGPLTDPAAFGGDASDAFDVIVASLPGYPFSTPLPRAGINFIVTADLWARLMVEVLGYDRFGAHASDWGMFVAAQLGHAHADRMIGVHLTGTPRLDGWSPTADYHPWTDYLGGVRRAVAPEHAGAVGEWARRRAGHLAVHMTDPQSMAHAMHDSPAGLASWLVQRRYAWSDCAGDVETRFTKDDLVTTAMLYWVTDSFASSIRYYAEAVATPWQPSHSRQPLVESPTGFTFFEPDRPPGLAVDETALARGFNLAFLRQHPRGGHFAPMEEPELLVDDVRDFFRPLR